MLDIALQDTDYVMNSGTSCLKGATVWCNKEKLIHLDMLDCCFLFSDVQYTCKYKKQR